jgi:hypothetical protein
MNNSCFEWLLSASQECLKKIRIIEDESSKLSVDPSGDRVYIALMGYRAALNDAIAESRRAHDGAAKGKGF